jgi:hypothetical protein
MNDRKLNRVSFLIKPYSSDYSLLLKSGAVLTATTLHLPTTKDIKNDNSYATIMSSTDNAAFTMSGNVSGQVVSMKGSTVKNIIDPVELSAIIPSAEGAPLVLNIMLIEEVTFQATASLLSGRKTNIATPTPVEITITGEREVRDTSIDITGHSLLIIADIPAVIVNSSITSSGDLTIADDVEIDIRNSTITAQGEVNFNMKSENRVILTEYEVKSTKALRCRKKAKLFGLTIWTNETSDAGTFDMDETSYVYYSKKSRNFRFGMGVNAYASGQSKSGLIVLPAPTVDDLLDVPSVVEGGPMTLVLQGVQITIPFANMTSAEAFFDNRTFFMKVACTLIASLPDGPTTWEFNNLVISVDTHASKENVGTLRFWQSKISVTSRLLFDGNSGDSEGTFKFVSCSLSPDGITVNRQTTQRDEILKLIRTNIWVANLDVNPKGGRAIDNILSAYHASSINVKKFDTSRRNRATTLFLDKSNTFSAAHIIHGKPNILQNCSGKAF